MAVLRDLAWDGLAVLKLFDAVNQVGAIDGNLKAQKVTFLYELAGQKRKIRAGHMRFTRFKRGPYSWQLAALVEMLEAGGFIDPDTRHLTNRGRYVLEYATPELSDTAKGAFELAERTADDYGSRTGPELTTLVYAMSVPVFDLGGEFLRMKKIRQGVDILRPAEQPELADPSADVSELLDDLTAEFAITPRSLNPATPEARERTMDAVQRAIAELTH